MLGTSLLQVVLPLQMGEYGYSIFAQSVVMAVYFLGLMMGSIINTRLIHNVGHVRAFAAFATLFSAVIIMHPLFKGVLFWGGFRFLTGFLVAGILSCVESWVNERSDTKNRGSLLGIYMTTVYGASVGGQLLINLWPVMHVEFYLLASILISVSLLPVVMARVRIPDTETVTRLSFTRLFQASPVGFIGIFISGLTLGTFYGLNVIYSKSEGWTVVQVSFFAASFILGSTILQFPVGWISDKIDRRWVMVGMCIMLVFGSVIIFLDVNFTIILVAVFFIGGAIGSFYPLNVAQTYDYLDPQEYVAGISGLLVIYALGAFLGPLVAGFIMDVTKPFALFIFLSGTSVAFLCFLLYRIRVREPIPQDDREDVVVMPRTLMGTGTDQSLDPRIEEVK